MFMTEEEVTTTLEKMETNPFLVTKSVYKGNVEQWPEHKMSFVDYHLAYLKVHPALDPQQYLANLRLMLRAKP
ncbi:MAG: hypothetical protein JWS12_134 [Candidatus Saccharibacteria bacterium]|nr:hypothetical protein [Candidatus Saccharibacteria bacterium]